jgi:hypothetical protein
VGALVDWSNVFHGELNAAGLISPASQRKMNPFSSARMLLALSATVWNADTPFSALGDSTRNPDGPGCAIFG